jgi:hypothetical protein
MMTLDKRRFKVDPKSKKSKRANTAVQRINIGPLGKIYKPDASRTMYQSSGFQMALMMPI